MFTEQEIFLFSQNSEMLTPILTIFCTYFNVFHMVIPNNMFMEFQNVDVF